MARVNVWGAEDNSGGGAGWSGEPPNIGQPSTPASWSDTGSGGEPGTGVDIGEPPQEGPARDECCKRNAAASEQIAHWIQVLVDVTRGGLDAQGKAIDGLGRRLERAIKTGLKDGSRAIADALTQINLTLQGRLGAQREQARQLPQPPAGPPAAAPAAPPGAGPMRPGPAPAPVPEQPQLGQPPEAPPEEEKPKEEQPKPPEEGQACQPIKPPEAKDDSIRVMMPWGKEREGKAGLWSEWGQIQWDEASGKHQPIKPFLDALCQPDPFMAVENIDAGLSDEIHVQRVKVELSED